MELLSRFILSGFELFIILFVMFVVQMAIVMIYKIWIPDRCEIEELRKLKETVSLANKGNKEARTQCDMSDLVKKNINFSFLAGGYFNDYSLRWIAVYQIFH